METNLKRMIARCVSIVIFLLSLAASAADFYVTPMRVTRVPKMDRRKCRDLAAVLRIAEPGDVIHLATGTYSFPRKGIELSTPVTMLGGYSTDFKMRDPLKTPSCIFPTGVYTTHQPHVTFSFFNLDFASATNLPRTACPPLILDGLTFNAATFTNLAGRLDSRINLQIIPTGPLDARLPMTLLAGENLVYPLDLTIRNCAFLNSYGTALQLNWCAGSLVLSNNTFTQTHPFAINITGPFLASSIPCTIANNTLPMNSLRVNYGVATNCLANTFTSECVDAP